MGPLDLIQHILKKGPDGSSSHRLLEGMCEEPIEVASLVEGSSRSKRSISRFFEPLIQEGLVLEENGYYQLTCAGASVLREIEQKKKSLEAKSSDEKQNVAPTEDEAQADSLSDSALISQPEGDRDGINSHNIHERSVDPLSYLIRSENRIELLRALRAGTVLKADLAQTCSPSRSTVGRTIDKFEEYGWVKQRGGRCEVLAESERAVRAYAELVDSVGTVLDNVRLLRGLGPEYGDIPLDALNDTEPIVASETARDRMTKAVCDLSDVDVDRIRGVVCVHTQMSADAFEHHFTGDTEIELIIGSNVHREILRLENILEFKKAIGSGVSGFSMKVHPRVESSGFGILGDELVIIAGDKGQTHPVGAVSTNDLLIHWAEEKFDQFDKGASPMLEHFRKVASNVARKFTSNVATHVSRQTLSLRSSDE